MGKSGAIYGSNPYHPNIKNRSEITMKEPIVTRTIKAYNVSYLGVDLNTHEVGTFMATAPARIKDKETMLKYLTQVYNTTVEGYKVTIESAIKDMNARERIAVKSLDRATSLDSVTEIGNVLTVTVENFVVLHVHNEKAKEGNNKDYTVYVII